jgi:predicted transposase YdaD
MVKEKNKVPPQVPNRVPLGNIYDRVFKENARALVPFFMDEPVTNIKQVKDSFPISLERELDMLFKVEFPSGEISLLHLEFQAAPHPDMAARMLVYFALAKRHFKLPLRQLVIYVGKGSHGMPNRLDDVGLAFEYKVVSLNEIAPERFLSAQVPEIVMLALLSKYDKEQSERILRLTIDKLWQHAQGLKLEKLSKHLGILARLRNFDNELVKQLTDMPLYINPEEDMLYQKGMQVGELIGLDKGIEQGREQGIEQGREQGIEQGIEQGADLFLEAVRLCRAGLSLDNIAIQLDVSLSVVEQWIQKAKDNGLI